MDAAKTAWVPELGDLLHWRSLLRFVLLWIGSMILLSLLWRPVERPFGNWIRSTSEFALRIVAVGHAVDVRSEAREKTDTVIELVSRDGAVPGEELSVHFPMRWAAYTPIATFLALLAATRLPARRKLKGLVLGMLLVHLDLYLRLALQCAAGFSRHLIYCEAPHLHGFPWNEGNALPGLLEQLSRIAGTMVFHPVPVLVWLLVVLLPGGWRKPRG